MSDEGVTRTPLECRTWTRDERAAFEAEVKAAILALPPYTLFQIGWRTDPDHVQGQVYYRLGDDGCGPIGRDSDRRGVLRHAVSQAYTPYVSQPWGIQVLASPPTEAPASLLDDLRERLGRAHEASLVTGEVDNAALGTRWAYREVLRWLDELRAAVPDDEGARPNPLVDPDPEGQQRVEGFVQRWIDAGEPTPHYTVAELRDGPSVLAHRGGGVPERIALCVRDADAALICDALNRPAAEGRTP